MRPQPAHTSPGAQTEGVLSFPTSATACDPEPMASCQGAGRREEEREVYEAKVILRKVGKNPGSAGSATGVQLSRKRVHCPLHRGANAMEPAFKKRKEPYLQVNWQGDGTQGSKLSS